MNRFFKIPSILRGVFLKYKKRSMNKFDLYIKRKEFSPLSTLGDLYVFEKKFCKTLEDIVRADGIKVPGYTAIPAGEYKVKLTYSPTFKKLMPLIYNQDDYTIKINEIQFSGVRFHGGNDHFDTLACVTISKYCKKEKTIITTNNETQEVDDFTTWGSMSDEFNTLLEENKEYTLLIEN